MFSIDTPQGTGDHENYLKDERKGYRLKADGSIEFQYNDCEKKAVMVRAKNGHKPWYALSEYKLIFSNPATDRYVYMPKDYTRTLRPHYG